MNLTLQIGAFPTDGAPWRIDCLGALTQEGFAQGPPKIDVHLSELLRGSGDPLKKPSLVEPGHHKTISLNVDQIALLKQGSVWLNGFRRPPNESPPSRNLRVNARQFSFMRLDGTVHIDGVDHPLITPSRYRIGAGAFAAAAGTWLSVAYEPEPGLEFVAIPCTTIFQKCVATSSPAVRRLVFGELDKIIDPSSGLLKDDKTTFFAELFNDFRDDEAAAIANLLVDPVGRIEYARLRRTLIADSVNADRSGSKFPARSHLKFGLPFLNDVEMTVIGKRMAFDVTSDGKEVTKWGLLATEITHLKVKLAFDRIIIARKIGRSMKQGDEWSEGSYTPPARAALDGSQLLERLTSAVAPSRDYEAFTEFTAGGFVAKGLETVRQESEVDKFRKRPRKATDPAAFTGVGATGDTQSKSNGVAEVKIATSQTPSTPVSLEDFLEALELLASDGYPFCTVAVSSNYSTDGAHFVNYYAAKVAGSSSWHLLRQADPPVPRAFVIAQLHLGDVWHYFIELERKNMPIALQHIRSHDGSPIEAAKLLEFMNSVARHGGWKARQFHRAWIFTRINHLAGDRSERLKQSILNAL